MVNVPGGLRTVHIKGTRTGLTASITRERVNEIPLQFSGILYSFPGRWRQPIHISVLLLRTVQCLALFYQLFIASDDFMGSFANLFAYVIQGAGFLAQHTTVS